MNHLQYRVLGTISFLAFAFLVFSPIPAKAEDLRHAHFETQDFNGAVTNSLCYTHSAQIVNSIVRSGKYAVKFILNSDDAGYINGNWKDPARKAMLGYNNTAKVGDIRWYGMSINVDPSWRDDTNDPNGTILFQWHGLPDPGEKAKPPHLSIKVNENNWRITNLSDSNKISTKSSFKKIQWDGGKLEKGKWVDWVVYAKWSYKSDGVLKVWKDGKLVVDHRGPNTFNDENPEFIRLGIYKAWWIREQPPTRNTLTAYFDEIRIGDQNSSYAEVAPKGL